MGFVKTKEEIDRIKRVLTEPHFVNMEDLQISFLTEPEIVARLLPPPLKPTDKPIVTVMIAHFQSNCVGDYDSGLIMLPARYADIEAAYYLAMIVSTDAALIYGRELEGSPKKLGTAGFVRQGTKMYGWAERHGVKLIEIKADLTEDLGIPETRQTLHAFNIKALQASDGDGLEEDAILTLGGGEFDLTTNRAGKGSIVLRGTPHDPYDELEVKEVLGASYLEGGLIPSMKSIARIPAADFLPYYYGRVDDWSLLNTEDTLASI